MHTLHTTRLLFPDGWKYWGSCTGCGWTVSHAKSGSDEIEMCYRVAHHDLLAAAGSVLSGQRENCSDPPSGGVGAELPSAASRNTP